MGELTRPPSDLDRHSLFEACTREAQRIGGDERTAEYFFVRAQSSRVWLSSQGDVAVADMAIEDWCAAIAWSAPGVGRQPRRAIAHTTAIAASTPHPADSVSGQPSAAEPATENGSQRKKPRSGARFRRAFQT